jgi:hypothetical protein
VHRYTPAQIRFIESKITGRSPAEMTALFNRRFGLSITEGQIIGVAKYHKLRTGRDARFRTGNKPWNYRPVGTEQQDIFGYVKVKIADPGKWKYKHILIWEKANGKVPEGHAIIFADGNKSNMKLSNLLKVSRRELVVMNRLGLISADKSLTKQGKLIADVKLLITDRKRGLKKRKNSQKKKL